MSEAEQTSAHPGGPDDHHLFDQIPVFVWTMWPNGDLDFLNRYAEELFGESRASLYARRYTIVHPDDIPRVLEAQEKALTTGTAFRVEMRYGFADGTYHWFDVQARAVRDASGEIVRWIGTSTDIHDQYVARRALEESEMRYRLFAESTREGIWYLDLKTSRVEWNERTHELCGIPPSSFGGTFEAFAERVHPDDRVPMESQLKAHLERGEPYRLELRMRYGVTGQEYRTFIGHGLAERDEDGVPTCMVGGLEDITEHKEADRLLRERLDIIERQTREINELGTPIIEVWDGVVTMPLFGTIDAGRAERMMQVLLEAVTARQCAFAILDLTGAAAMDTVTAEHVARLLSAVGLLGAQGIVVGIRPVVARTMVELSVDLSRVTMLANLREALLYVMRRGARAGKRPQ